MTETQDNPDHELNENNSLSAIPLMTRNSLVIEKPKNWQDFQRNCVYLYQAELKDPHAKEYGRSGQAQKGIDILGRRDGKLDHWVGIQCRCVNTPLSKKTILRDCRETLTLKSTLKEIIFATTAPNDVVALDAAHDVELLLRSEGYDVTVDIYGWDALCLIIAKHDIAYLAFNPSAIASRNAPATPSTNQQEILQQLQTIIKNASGVLLTSTDASQAEHENEDKALHARIDEYRNIFKEGHAELAQNKLLELQRSINPKSSPWADFRIKTNLGSIAIEMGHAEDLIKYYTEAFDIRPSDPKAIANLSLAKIFENKFDEAMDLARQALASSPAVTYAVNYLLQAAARSNWQGNPETLIPENLKNSADADLGLAEFLRLREIPGWQTRAIEISDKHSHVDIFCRIKAQAVLAVASTNNSYLAGGSLSITQDDLEAAADEYLKIAERLFDLGFHDKVNSAATIYNAAVILRYCGRLSEAEAMVIRANTLGLQDPQLQRLLAMLQTSQGKHAEAVATLQLSPSDGESQILLAEIQSNIDLPSALNTAKSVSPHGLSTDVQKILHKTTANMAVQLGDQAALNSACASLEKLGEEPVIIKFFRLKSRLHTNGLDDQSIVEIQDLASQLPPDLDLQARLVIAQDLLKFGRPFEASQVLEGKVDLNRKSHGSVTYLKALAASRRDEAFLSSLKRASDSLRNDPEVLWASAAHAWNIGDLTKSLDEIKRYLQIKPDEVRGRLFKIEVLARQNNSADLIDELKQPIEQLTGSDLKTQLRIVNLLGHFGFGDRAAPLAYKLFLENPDNAQTWKVLSSMILSDGVNRQSLKWEMPVAATDAAIDLTFDDNEKQFFVIEDDPALRKIDKDSWESTNELAKVVMGKKTGDSFVLQSGRKGIITEIRHKYVARLHFIMSNYENRFPTDFFLRRVKIDATSATGLDEVKEQLKERYDWVDQEVAQYFTGPMPLSVLAHRIGMDTIDAANCVNSLGFRLKVSTGEANEKQLIAEIFGRHDVQRGCVLDLWTFWTAWQLRALSVVEDTLGPIIITQGTIDALHKKQVDASALGGDGTLKSLKWAGDKIQLIEISAGQVKDYSDEIGKAIKWLEEHAKILPVTATNDTPEALREYLQDGKPSIFHEIILSLQHNACLISEDLPIRQIADRLGVQNSLWLQGVFAEALRRDRIDLQTYTDWLVTLADSGHYYIPVFGNMLVGELKADVDAGKLEPGARFKTLAKALGGVVAEPVSHINVVGTSLRAIWADDQFEKIRQPASNLLLENLLKERASDFQKILRTIAKAANDYPLLQRYIHNWAIGHFTPIEWSVD